MLCCHTIAVCQRAAIIVITFCTSQKRPRRRSTSPENNFTYPHIRTCVRAKTAESAKSTKHAPRTTVCFRKLRSINYSVSVYSGRSLSLSLALALSEQPHIHTRHAITIAHTRSSSPPPPHRHNTARTPNSRRLKLERFAHLIATTTEHSNRNTNQHKPTRSNIAILQ